MKNIILKMILVVALCQTEALSSHKDQAANRKGNTKASSAKMIDFEDYDFTQLNIPAQSDRILALMRTIEPHLKDMQNGKRICMEEVHELFYIYTILGIEKQRLIHGFMRPNEKFLYVRGCKFVKVTNKRERQRIAEDVFFNIQYIDSRKKAEKSTACFEDIEDSFAYMSVKLYQRTYKRLLELIDLRDRTNDRSSGYVIQDDDDVAALEKAATKMMAGSKQKTHSTIQELSKYYPLPRDYGEINPLDFNHKLTFLDLVSVKFGDKPLNAVKNLFKYRLDPQDDALRTRAKVIREFYAYEVIKSQTNDNVLSNAERILSHLNGERAVVEPWFILTNHFYRYVYKPKSDSMAMARSSLKDVESLWNWYVTPSDAISSCENPEKEEFSPAKGKGERQLKQQKKQDRKRRASEKNRMQERKGKEKEGEQKNEPVEPKEETRSHKNPQPSVTVEKGKPQSKKRAPVSGKMVSEVLEDVPAKPGKNKKRRQKRQAVMAAAAAKEKPTPIMERHCQTPLEPQAMVTARPFTLVTNDQSVSHKKTTKRKSRKKSKFSVIKGAASGFANMMRNTIPADVHQLNWKLFADGLRRQYSHQWQNAIDVLQHSTEMSRIHQIVERANEEFKNMMERDSANLNTHYKLKQIIGIKAARLNHPELQATETDDLLVEEMMESALVSSTLSLPVMTSGAREFSHLVETMAERNRGDRTIIKKLNKLSKYYHHLLQGISYSRFRAKNMALKNEQLLNKLDSKAAKLAAKLAEKDQKELDERRD